MRVKKYILALLIFPLIINITVGKDNSAHWIKGGAPGCFRLMFSPNGQYLLSLNFLEAQIWSVEKKKLLLIIPFHLGYGSYPFVFSKNSENIFYGDSSLIKCLNIKEDTVLYTLHGHHGIVRSLALSSNKKTLLSAGDDSLVITYKLTPKKIVNQKIKLPEKIRTADFTGEGKYVAAVGLKHTYIININSGKIIHKFGKDYPSISSSGKVIAFTYKQKPGIVIIPGIKLYSLSGKIIKTILFPQNNEAVDFKLTKDGKFLLVIDDKGNILVYDAGTGKLLRNLPGTFDSPITISSDNRFVAVCKDNSEISIWDFTKGKLFVNLGNITGSQVQEIAISSDFNYAASSNYDDGLFLWNLKTGALIKKLSTHHFMVDKIISGKNNLSASKSAYGELYVWESDSGKNLYQIQVDGLRINDAAFSHDGKYIATIASSIIYDPGSSRGNYHADSVNVSLWNAVTGKRIKEFPFTQYDSPVSLSFSSDDKMLFVINNFKLQQFDIRSEKLVKENKFNDACIFSPKGNYLAEPFYNGEGNFAIWDIKKDTLVKAVHAYKWFLRTISFSNDEKLIVTTGQDVRTMKVWENPSGKLIKKIIMNVPAVVNGSISPDGKYFASGSKNGEINIWDLHTGKIIQSLKKYLCYNGSISWSPDGKYVFAGYQDGSIISIAVNSGK